MGYQHSGIHNSGSGRRRGHWASAQWLNEYSGLDTGVDDPLGHFSHSVYLGMGLCESERSKHLTRRSMHPGQRNGLLPAI